MATNDSLQGEPGVESQTLDVMQPNAAGLHIAMFEIEKELGEGKSSHVHLAKHKQDEYKCALKIVVKANFVSGSSTSADRSRQEIETLKNLSHPNILQLYGHFEDEKNIYVVREFIENGDLYKLFQQRGCPFSEPEAAEYITQAVNALQYLHGKNIMHRDLKPEHILVGVEGDVKLSGFYWSECPLSGRSDLLCGTLDYLPPEMLRPGTERYSYDKKVDMWSLGVMIYELLVGSAPFEDNPVMTQRRITRGDYQIPHHLSTEARDLIVKKLLVNEPENRLSVEEVQQHPWIIKRGQCEDSTTTR